MLWFQGSQLITLVRYLSDYVFPWFVKAAKHFCFTPYVSQAGYGVVKFNFLDAIDFLSILHYFPDVQNEITTF